MQYDVFISHASEDKEFVARPLSQALEKVGVRVWLDEVVIGWGDSLSDAIDRGLAQSRFGIVVLSESFFSKKWTARELSGLVNRQVGEGRVIVLPLYVDVDNNFVREQSPPLADQKALNWSMGADAIADRFKAMLDDIKPVTESSASVASGNEMAKRVRALIGSSQFIAIEELILFQTNEALRLMRSPLFSTESKAMDNQGFYDDFIRRTSLYENIVEELSATMSVVSYYGSPEFGLSVRRALEKLTDEPNDLDKNFVGGVTLWNDLRKYPSLIVFHRTGAAAVAGEKWQNLRPLFKEAKASRGSLDKVRVPILERMRPSDLTRTSSDQWFANDGPDIKQNFYTPVEDKLGGLVVESLSWLGIDEREAQEIFDMWLFLAQIAYLTNNGDPNSYNYFSAGRWYRYRDSWSRSPLSDFIKKIEAEGESTSLFKSGISTNMQAFMENAETAKKMVLDQSKYAR